MRKKRYRKGELRKMAKETWDLDYAFIKWLYPRLLMYKKEAGKIIDLEYPGRFTYNNKEYNQLELINMLIDLCYVYLKDDMRMDKEFQLQDILNIWAVVGPAMWW